MPSQETISSLIAAAYGAATESSRWPTFLEAFSAAIGGGATILTVEHPGRTAEPSIETYGFSDEAVSAYAEHFVSIDPLQAQIVSEPEGVLDFGEPYVPRSVLERTEIFNDWYRPNGLGGDSLGGVVLRRGHVPSVIGAYQEKGSRLYGKDELQVAQLLAPHVKQALRIHYRLGEASRTEDLLLGTLDEFKFGIVLVAPNGRVIVANERARRLAASKDGIRLSRGKIRCSRSEDTGALQRLIAGAVRTIGRGEFSSGGAMTIGRSESKPALQVLVTPLNVSARDGPAEFSAAVFIHDPEDMGRAGGQRLQELFGLTPRQAAVAAALSDGRTLSEAADSLGMSINTAKVRLQEVFAKTDTRRQPDLMRLLATLSQTRNQV